jgi:hypothetical protein
MPYFTNKVYNNHVITIKNLDIPTLLRFVRRLIDFVLVGNEVTRFCVMCFVNRHLIRSKKVEENDEINIQHTA